MRASVVRTDEASAGLLHVGLMGELTLRRDGVSLSLPASRRTRALLGYLVATAAPQSRSALCDLLWDGPDDPRASLRWSLTKLRAVVDAPARPRLLADRDHVAFDASACEVDTERLGRLLAAGTAAASIADLEEAARLMRGAFLDGLDLPVCYRFHHWCMAERERYGAWRRKVLQALVDRLGREPERALPHGRAMVAADPLDETAHAALVYLLAAAGRYPDAEQHYTWARDLLRREVAMPTGGPLDEAIHRARRERREAASAHVDPPNVSAPGEQGPPPASGIAPDKATGPAGSNPPALPAREVLLGRAAECDAIERSIAGTGSAPLLLFTGEPGMGKTRLLDQFAAEAVTAGRRVIRGRCFQAEMVRPYGLWFDALRGLPTEQLAPDIVDQAAPLLLGRAVEGGNRERLFDAATVLLGKLSALQPLALVLDDLQWIDEGSAALLHFLVRTLGSVAGSSWPRDDTAPLVFAGAARVGEMDDNPSVRGLLQSLDREGGVNRLALAPLAPAEAGALIGAAPLDPMQAWHQSGGNPLYLIELAQAAQRGAAAAAGTSIHRLIEMRVAGLDDGSRDLLSWAAASGRELRPELVADAAGLPVADVLSRMERLERHGLLVPTKLGHFDFAHDLVRQTLYRSLSQPRRRTIHRRFVHVLQVASADEPALHGEIVHHAELAGDMSAASRACAVAGEFCLRLFANAQAAAVADRGLAHVVELTPGAERVGLEIGLLRLRVAAAAGAGGRRLPALADRIESAIADAEALGLHAQAAAGWEILAYWSQQASDSGRTREATLAAERMTRRADATTHCLQLANSGRCLLDIEVEPQRGRALLEQAAALAAELDIQVMEVAWGRGLVARADGHLDAAYTALAQAVAQARLAENHWREFECTVWLATVAFERAMDAEVLRHVDEIAAAAARMGEPQAPFAQALGALVRWRQGESGAEGVLAEALDALRELDDKAHLAYALNEAAALALTDSRREVAAAWAGEALAAAQAVRRPTEVAVALARLASAETDAGRAADWLAAWGQQRQEATEEAAAEAAKPSDPVWPEAGAPSARAAAALAQAARALPTVTPTAAP